MTDSRDEHEPYGFTESPVIASIDLGDLVALQTKIVRLTAERDEARREIAHRVFVSGGLRPAELAESRGWDCFKEEGK
jgi:hypothetical protein